MKTLCYISLIIIQIVLSLITVIGKPYFLTCDTYATSFEVNTDCDISCGNLLERMYNCPPCRYFVLNHLRQGSSCFCTVCFKQFRHRRRHYQPLNEQDLYPRFDF